MQKVLIFAIIMGLYATITEFAIRYMYDSLHIIDGKCYYKLVTMDDGEVKEFNPECERWTCSANTSELFVDGCPPGPDMDAHYTGRRYFWPDCCNDTFTDKLPEKEYTNDYYGEYEDS